MNAQIEKLAEQALHEYNATYHNEVKIPEAYLKKFAELLVSECASAVNSRDDSDTGFWANIIKKHFGFEE